MNHISEKLWQLHKPKRVFVRLLALLVALAVFCLIFGGKVGAFAQLESVAFLVLPVMLILPSLFFSSRLKLKDINFYATMSACLGCLTGVASVILNFSDPSYVGPGMALALLCAIYATLFLNVGKWTLVFFVVINVSLSIIFAFSLSAPVPDIQAHSIFERTNLIRLAAISLSGLMAGWARWGLDRLPQFLPRIAVGIMLIYMVLLLMNMRSLEEYYHVFCLGFLPIMILPFLQKFLLYCSSHSRSTKIR